MDATAPAAGANWKHTVLAFANAVNGFPLECLAKALSCRAVH
jgi:hypothetical protein